MTRINRIAAMFLAGVGLSAALTATAAAEPMIVVPVVTGNDAVIFQKVPKSEAPPGFRISEGEVVRVVCGVEGSPVRDTEPKGRTDGSVPGTNRAKELTCTVG